MSNIGNNNSNSQGAENVRGVRFRRRQTNVIRPRLSPDVLMVIPQWMRSRVRQLNIGNRPTMLPIIEISLDHYDTEEVDVGTDGLYHGDVVDNRVERLETIEE